MKEKKFYENFRDLSKILNYTERHTENEYIYQGMRLLKHFVKRSEIQKERKKRKYFSFFVCSSAEHKFSKHKNK